MKRYRLSVPARINVLGNPSDANEGELHTISMAIELRAGAWVEPAECLQFDEYRRRPDGELELATRVEDPEVALEGNGQAGLQKAALRRLLDYSPELAAKLQQRKVRLATWTDVPRLSGLGGSSLLVILALAALREAYELDRRVHNDYVLAELTQRVEAQELGIVCGYADRYVPLFGGLAYIDYRGKLYQRPLGEEPYCTYERLDHYVDTLPLVVCSTGLDRASGDVHGIMRPRYLEEHESYLQTGGERPFMLRTMDAVGEAAWRGKIALLAGDLSTFGRLMNENHRLVNGMMDYCGLKDEGVQITNRLIRAALSAGALGAKLTGAGGRGSVFALVNPDDMGRVADAFHRAAREEALGGATVFVPEIAHRGLQVAELEREAVLP